MEVKVIRKFLYDNTSGERLKEITLSLPNECFNPYYTYENFDGENINLSKTFTNKQEAINYFDKQVRLLLECCRYW